MWPVMGLPNFRGAPKIHSGPLAKALCLVRYYTRRPGADPGANWWTTCKVNQAMRTVVDVRKQLALPLAWGARNGRVFATIPAGASVVYVEGVAAKQCEPSGDPCYPGGSRQLLFVDRDFQRSWFTKYECEVKSERTSNAFEACAG